MKTLRNFLYSGVILAAILLGALSCHKITNTNNGITDTDTQTAVVLSGSTAAAESLFDDAFDLVMENAPQATVNPTSTSGKTVNSIAVNTSTSNCATVTLTPADGVTYPKTLTIDFGTGCTSSNNITRKGKLVVTLSGPVRTAGSVLGITLNNYSVNGNTLSGAYSFTASAGTNGGVNYSLAINNATITLSTGAVYTYGATETFTQTAGMSTTDVSDDVYSITGNFSYTGNGTSITGSVVTPLVRASNCPNIESGTIAFVYNSINAVLDFGTGTCDAAATVDVNNATQTILLPR